MEYCELGDLSLFIKKREKLGTHPATADMARKYPSTTLNSGLNEVIVRHFLKQLASALQFLRAGNFIHRDIKPQNLLLNPSIQFLRLPGAPLIMSANAKSLIPDAGIESLPMLKIADFGFARSLPQTSLAETLCGSPLYMAPEILRYEKYDAKADLWSVGTVLFEMISGKPPFRANNHVELLRKIEQGNDEIRFHREVVVSSGMKQVIRDLLKRNPVERISFENFFNHKTIVEEIPGLVEDDLPPPLPKPAEPVEASKSVDRKSSLRDVERINRAQRSNSDVGSYDASSRGLSGPPREDRGQQASRETPPKSRLDTYEVSRGESSSRRPPIKPAATAPNPRELQDQGGIPRNVAMVRQASRESASPGSSLLTDKPTQNPSQKKDDRTRRDEREKAAMDVAFERDYVLVEKRAIEVNAFADELAAGSGKKLPKHSTSAGSLTRRATTQGAPNSGTGAVPASTARAVSINQGRQVQDNGMRQGSYERRYGPNGPSPSSATSMISKAVQAASLRLLGFYSPPSLGIGKKESPPQMYNPFPAYPTSPGTLGLLSDGKSSSLMDEDFRAAAIIEEKASISDVVYGFAEIKYRQLFPNTPSMDYGLPQPEAEPEEDGLTVEAIVELSEEALVLYVNNLGLLAKAMDIAGAWWVNKTRNDRTTNQTNVHASNRINSVVQWLRTRFNEVLEKAEVVRLKLLAAQKSLPRDHPGYPGNRDESKGTHSTEGVFLSTGITAEKVLYDRALEMSRTAAVDEIANCNLKGCEIGYISAIRMLEAVLETESKEEGAEWMGDDREAVVKGTTRFPCFQYHNLQISFWILRAKPLSSYFLSCF